MSKKAFTLVELIAIIIIMASILLIVLPAINQTIKKSEQKKKEDELNNIYMATENYLMTNYDNYDRLDMVGGIEYIYVTELINNSYISVNTLNPNTGSSFTSQDAVMVSRNADKTLSYQLIFAERLSEYILRKHPYLELGESGCKSTNPNNYSYMGGCYIKGDPDVNYIWFAGFFWKPMGFNKDGTLRLIAAEPTTAIPWGGDDVANTWQTSYVNNWLNNYYLDNISDFYQDIIYTQDWCIQKTDNSKSSRKTCDSSSIIKSKVGLITLDEYNLAGGGDSYINGFGYIYTMTPGTEKNKIWRIEKRNIPTFSTITYADSIVPVINIDGYEQVVHTIQDDIIFTQISDKKDTYLTDFGESGEFVNFSGKKYRIVTKDEDGNIKLFLDDYYEKNNSIYDVVYGSSNILNSSTDIGKILNNEVLDWLIDKNNVEDRNKIIYNYTWNLNYFNIGDNYEISIKDINPDVTTNSTVGLIRLGEILATQGLPQLTSSFTNKVDYSSAHDYWGMTPMLNDYTWSADDSSGFGWPIVNTSKRAIRPVIVIKSDTKIKSGKGTWLEPYEI